MRVFFKAKNVFLEKFVLKFYCRVDIKKEEFKYILYETRRLKRCLFVRALVSFPQEQMIKNTVKIRFLAGLIFQKRANFTCTGINGLIFRPILPYWRDFESNKLKICNL